MSYVHYKFSSKLHYKTVPFDGLHITLKELKRKIMGRECLKATKADLQITNEQTGEEYTDDEAHIRKHSSVIVHRTPPGGVKPAGRTFIVTTSNLNEFTIDFHKELMKSKNSPKRRRPSYSRSRSVSRSDSRFRSWSRSPGGFWSRSPGGRKPPPRELPQLELKGPTPGARRERERYRQWEKEYTDWCNKCYKDYDNQHPSINKTPPISSKPASGSGVAKAPTSKSAAAPAKPSNKTVSKTQSDNTRKEKAQKVKPKEKAEAVKEKNDKVKQKTPEAVVIKKKDSSSSVAKPIKTIKANPEDNFNSTTPKKEKNPTVQQKGLDERSCLHLQRGEPLAKDQGVLERDCRAQTESRTESQDQTEIETECLDQTETESVALTVAQVLVCLPGGFWSRSPGGRKPPPRELPQLELKGPTPGARRERERYRQWEKEYTDWCNKCYKDYDNQHPSINKTPPVSSKPASGSGVAKAPTSKSPAAPAKPSNKTVSKTQSDNTRKEKAQKVKPKVKTEAVKEKNDKVNQKTPEAVVIKKKDSSSSSSSSVAKPVKTIKANPEDNFNSTTPKKEKSKSSTVRPPLLKTPPLSSQTLPLPHPSLPDGPRLSHDIRGRRDLPPGSGLLPMPPAQRRIKLNRYLGRKGSTETSASDRAPLGPEKMSSTSDRSASSSVSEGDRSNSTTEGAGRKELSASAERRASRERPGSAGERLQGSDREQDRVSGPDRDRDRVSGSDRDRGVASERERERDRVSGSSSQKVAATAERDGDRERSVVVYYLNVFKILFITFVEYLRS
ncbi:E3 ubiquitin-protein ligase RBBP6-like [Hippoglossus stenolepis]|uniref:E3 ubiquitin-protein ligase RBBP6-like n=1 Tax=Hippoglossus stenolepis TaxID=195615 RepID=UPI001FAF8D64|nr:E3 ubiquitin-protein ligase RBBP6-like [Hippoglossus stenolepis]